MLSPDSPDDARSRLPAGRWKAARAGHGDHQLRHSGEGGSRLIPAVGKRQQDLSLNSGKRLGEPPPTRPACLWDGAWRVRRRWAQLPQEGQAGGLLSTRMRRTARMQMEVWELTRARPLCPGWGVDSNILQAGVAKLVAHGRTHDHRYVSFGLVLKVKLVTNI